MSTSATGYGDAGYVVVHPLFLAIKIIIISIVYMFVILRSHMHMFDVTNLALLFFWIKLILKLPKYLIAFPYNRKEKEPLKFRFHFVALDYCEILS